ncbi:hypothetical protein MMC30_009431 [Trapelia coarctata]|nr:hypothetical protein [Trapelia coarctata]
MLVLPLPVIWHLHTNINQKIGLTITFLTGSVGMITAIVRLVSFFGTDPFEDLTYGVIDITWSFVEPGVYLIASCLPSLRPLFKYVFRDVKLGAVYIRFPGYNSKLWSH